MRMPLSLGLTVVLSLSLVGCGRDNPAAPSPTLTGTWRGTLTRGLVSGTITLQMTQSGGGVTGSWSATMAGDPSSQTGSLGGTIVGTTVSLSLTPIAPVVCGPDVTLSGTLSMNGVLDRNRLAGDYIVFLCDSAGSGRIEVTRE